MRLYPDEPAGVLERGLLESGLQRPVAAARYEIADACRQAATLLWGLIKNHPFRQGNKRTATFATFFFLWRAGYLVEAPLEAVLDIVYAIAEGQADVDGVAG